MRRQRQDFMEEDQKGEKVPPGEGLEKQPTLGQRARLAEKSLRDCMEVVAQEGKRKWLIWEARVLCALVRSL